MPARGERREAGPAHARVDAARQRPGAVRVERRPSATSFGATQSAGAATCPDSGPEPGHSCAEPGLVGASVVLSSWPQPRNSRPAGRYVSTVSGPVGGDRVVVEAQVIDGLVVVRAAQQLALRAVLADGDLDRGDVSSSAVFGVRAGRAPIAYAPAALNAGSVRGSVLMYALALCA